MRVIKRDTVGLVTGGCGSIGSAIVKKLLDEGIGKVRILDHRESELKDFVEELKDKRVRPFIGDVRDRGRVDTAMEGVDIVFHAAALKHVDLCEYNPFEPILTNIDGTWNICESASWFDVKRVLNISTDKAVYPISMMGATKMISERLVCRSNYRVTKTIFSNVRFGNVTWSNGSVFPIFSKQINKQCPITVTSLDMERYYMTIKQAVDLVLMAMNDMKGGETFILKMPTFKMGDLVNAIGIVKGEQVPVEITGARPGERLREELMTEEEKKTAIEKEHYWVLNGNKDIYS